MKVSRELAKKWSLGVQIGGRGDQLRIVADGEVLIQHHRHHQHPEVALG